MAEDISAETKPPMVYWGFQQGGGRGAEGWGVLLPTRGEVWEKVFSIFG